MASFQAAASEVTSSRLYPSGSGQHLQVYVQVCGRQETVQLNHMGLHELSDAIHRKLELQPPFLFLDPDGRPLVDNAALATCASLGKQVIVKLTEGVLHDVSRRVDQLRHLQWGFIADQLSALKREQDRHQAEVSSWKAWLAQEHSLLEKSHCELRQRVEVLYGISVRETDGGSSQAPVSVPSAALLAEIHSLQSTCQTEIKELKRELGECQTLFKDAKLQSPWQAVEELLKTERQEQLRLINDLKMQLLQKHNHLDSEFRALFSAHPGAVKLTSDAPPLRESCVERNVVLPEHFVSGNTHILNRSPADRSEVTGASQQFVVAPDDSKGRQPQRHIECETF